jgi:hypothetical protein
MDADRNVDALEDQLLDTTDEQIPPAAEVADVRVEPDVVRQEADVMEIDAEKTEPTPSGNRVLVEDGGGKLSVRVLPESSSQ